MTVVFQKMIFRVDIQANPEALYLFGDNEMRVGSGGQALEMRGEPNSHGIRTKKKPLYDLDAYWTDSDLRRQCLMIDEDFRPIVSALIHNSSMVIVVPLDGLGTGMSQLPERAPRTLAYIEKWIERIKNF